MIESGSPGRLLVQNRPPDPQAAPPVSDWSQYHKGPTIVTRQKIAYCSRQGRIVTVQKIRGIGRWERRRKHQVYSACARMTPRLEQPEMIQDSDLEFQIGRGEQ